MEKIQKGRKLEIEIPNDILEEILLRLPVKSLIRFQTVSKHWSRLIRWRDFGDRYMAHQKAKDPPRLLFVSNDLLHGANKAVTLDTMALGATSAWVENHQSFEYKKANVRISVSISESCDGIFCIYSLAKRQVEVINPATAMFITLPQSRIQRLLSLYPEREPPVEGLDPVPSPYLSFSHLGFGKDSVTGRYKIVWLYNSCPDTTCEVLDLEVREWRFVNTTSLDHHHILYDVRPTFVNGSFYWLSGDGEGAPTTQTKLIVFDIHTEMFQLIPTPPCITRDASSDQIGICNLHGRLCVSEINQDSKQQFWWSSDINNNTSWEKIFSVDLLITSSWFHGLDPSPLTPLAILRDSNKVILSLSFYHNLVAFDLDPDSTVYHLYFSGDYGLAVPYFPSLTLF